MGYKIKKIYVWSDQVRPSKRLPNLYQEVEYIESSGTQYIDTWVKPTNKTKVDNKWYFTSGVCYWVGKQGVYQSFCLLSNSNTYYRARVRSWANANGTITSSVVLNTTPHEFSISQWDGFYIDGTKISGNFTSYTFTESYNIYVFWWNTQGTFIDWGVTRLYYMEIYEDWTLIRNFIPCYRKADTVIWLYDIVNNVFYTNSWTWTFIKWNDVN